MPSCTTCKLEKDESNFNKSKYSKSGFHHYCRSCQHERYKKRREKLKSEDPEGLRLTEKTRAADRRAKMKELGLIPSRKRRVPYSVYKLTAAYRARRMYFSAKSRAEKYNEKFDLDQEWIKRTLDEGVCERSGVAFDLNYEKGKYTNAFGPSIDRIDSSKGYTKINCQIVCNMYNTGKGQHSDAEFIEFCKQVARFNAGTNDSEC